MAIKPLVLASDSENVFYHSSVDLPVGKIIHWVGVHKQGTFGDYELLLDHTRPKIKCGRLDSFYLAKSRKAAERFGSISSVFKVIPVGRFNSHYLGWIGLLLKAVKPTGFKRNYGYTIANPLAKLNEEAVYLCAKYWSGDRPTAKDLKQFDYDPDGETYLEETLASKIKVLKELL